MTSRCATSLSTVVPGKRSRTSACCRHRANEFRSPSSAQSRKRTRAPKSIAKDNQRYVAIKYSVRGRALGDAVREAIQKVDAQVKLPRGYHIGWEGEYQSEVRAEARMLIIVPLTVLLIFIILYSMYGSFKWAMLILATVAMASIGGLLALLVTHTNFSVSSERRLPGALRRFRADRRHHAGVHQSAARARAFD